MIKSMKVQILFSFTLVLFVNSIRANDCFIRFDVKNVDKNVKSYSVLVNARKFLSVNDYKTSIDGSVSLHLPISSIFISDGNHSIGVYAFNSTLSLIDLQNIFISSHEYNNCKNEVNKKIIPVPFEDQGHSIGVQYCVWHGYATTGALKMQRLGSKVKTIEKLVELGESIGDYWSHGVNETDALGGYYQVEPEQGFYCFYRKRDNENTSLIEECDNISTNLAKHALMLSSSGVDYVYVDLTNFCLKSDDEDVIQRRPMEVLFEEWHKLRTEGKQTPQIVVWHKMDLSQCTTWREYLNLYDKYPDLVWKDFKTGKKVFMGFGGIDPNVKKSIEENGGKNDVVVVNTFLPIPSSIQAGNWQFMGYCGGENNAYSTDIVSRSTCNQSVTRNSPIGDQISTGVSYQLDSAAYASASWGASTSFYGLTFLLQWDTALRENPQHITISGWNEHFAGPQPNPFGGYVHSIGLKPTDNRLFVDLYGAYRSRDIEPTVEYGNLFYDLMQSCLRVRKINLHLNRNDCSVDNEICCQLNRFQQFVEIHSLVRNDSNDFVLVNNKKDMDYMVSMNYKEVCAVWNSAHDFCWGGNPNDLIAGLSGPFIMFDRDGKNRKPLYRCKTEERHFVSTDPKCDNFKTVQLLGYLSTKKDSQFARSLTKCLTKGDVHYHALDGECHQNDTKQSILGFVI